MDMRGNGLEAMCLQLEEVGDLCILLGLAQLGIPLGVGIPGV